MTIYTLPKPPMFTVAGLEALTLELEDAHAKLLGAATAYQEAVDALAGFKQALEAAKAQRLLQGIEGKNAETREATLRQELQAEHDAVYQAEFHVSAARLELDAARLEWDLLRYRLRAFEAAAKLLELGGSA